MILQCSWIDAANKNSQGRNNMNSWQIIQFLKHHANHKAKVPLKFSKLFLSGIKYLTVPSCPLYMAVIFHSLPLRQISYCL